MTKDNEQYAYFTVTGDFDPDSITARLHLEPTEQWIKGSRNERTHLERKFSRWSLESRLERSAPLEDHVRDVLDQTLRCAGEIIKVGKEHTAHIQLCRLVLQRLPRIRPGWKHHFRISTAECRH